MSMHSDWDAGQASNLNPAANWRANLSPSTAPAGLAASPSIPKLQLVSRSEFSQAKKQAEDAGLIWVWVDSPPMTQRGRLALVIEAAIEAALREQGAEPPRFNKTSQLEASLKQQLFRAQTLGARGLSLGFGTLVRITNPAGALDVEDSAILRWWLSATDDHPVRLVLDTRDRYLGVYTRPVALESLLPEGKSSFDGSIHLGATEPTSAELPEALLSGARAKLPAPSVQNNTEIAGAAEESTLTPEEQNAVKNLAENLKSDLDLSGEISPFSTRLPPPPPAPLKLSSNTAPTADEPPTQSLAAGSQEELETQAETPAPGAGSGGQVRQLAFRSVLAALEAIEDDECEESPMAPEIAPADFPEFSSLLGAAEEAKPAELTVGPEAAVSSEPSLSISEGNNTKLSQLQEPEESNQAARLNSELQDLLAEADMPPEEEPLATTQNSAEAAILEEPGAEEQVALSELAPPPAPQDSEAHSSAERGPEAPEEAPQSAGASALSQLSPQNSLQIFGPSSEVPSEAPEVSAEKIPEEIWRGWVRDLEAAKGPKPLTIVERLFTTAYMPLLNARATQGLDEHAEQILDNWATAFATSYSSAFNALRAGGRRPSMVLDVPDIALRHGRMHGARQAQLILVDGLRFDLGQKIHEHLKELADQDAACVERLLLWAALPASTETQLELLGRGPAGLKEPLSSERSIPVARGRAASTLRRVKTGQHEVMKLDLVESRLSETHANHPAHLEQLGIEAAEILWEHMASLPPRTLVLIFGDHGRYIDPETQRAPKLNGERLATPEEVLVPAFAWLTGHIH